MEMGGCHLSEDNEAVHPASIILHMLSWMWPSFLMSEAPKKAKGNTRGLVRPRLGPDTFTPVPLLTETSHVKRPPISQEILKLHGNNRENPRLKWSEKDHWIQADCEDFGSFFSKFHCLMSICHDSTWVSEPEKNSKYDNNHKLSQETFDSTSYSVFSLA
jgi:hypothetical protein